MSLTKPFTALEETPVPGCIQHLAGGDQLLPELPPSLLLVREFEVLIWALAALSVA
jgi:hypothetical protein